MDCDNGKLISFSTYQKYIDGDNTSENRYKLIHPTPKQETRMRVSRNDKCPCGSGKKFKKCCLRKRK